MTDFTPKHDIDEYIVNNELNSRIYKVLLSLQEEKRVVFQRRLIDRKALKRRPIEIFNQAYQACLELENEKRPENCVLPLREKIQELYLNYEADIILSCVYVILYFSNSANTHIEYCLHKLRNNLENVYFKEFEHLLKEELSSASLPKDIEQIKQQAEQIENLTERELFLSGLLTRFNQAKAKGNITEQITHEIELIKRRRELATTTTNTTEPEANNSQASIKVSTAVILEMLKLLGHGKATNDLTKICKLIAFITGRSYEKIYNEAQKGIYLTSYHAKEITEINKILSDLNISISIEKDKQY